MCENTGNIGGVGGKNTIQRGRQKISVIIPAYNAEKYISKCLDSVVNQTYRNLEIIIIDDRSTDATGKIIDSYAADDRCKIVHQENAGIAETRNRALSMCSGDYIGWVDADDYVELNMFEKMVNVMESENCDICICNYTYERNNHVLEKNVALNEGENMGI